MASVSFSLNRGGTAFSVLVGTDAPSSGDFEVSIDMAKFPANLGAGVGNEVQMLLEFVKEYISGKSNTIF